MPQTFVRKTSFVEALQFDGSKESAEEIIHWVLSNQKRLQISYCEAVPAWQSEDGKMGHPDVPAQLFFEGSYLVAGDWVVAEHPVVMGHFHVVPQQEMEENWITYDKPAPQPTGHEETSDAIHLDRIDHGEIKLEPTEEVTNASAS